MIAEPPPIRFSVDDADRAGDEWRFNCGPASLCAVLELTPAEVRPHMQDFEQKGYTNPTLMWAALRSLQAKWSTTTLGRRAPGSLSWPRFGLARIQWAGPWTAEGVPIKARYRQTHWIGSWWPNGRSINALRVFDVNAICCGGWLPLAEWSKQLVPWLLRECVPRANGEWWKTHAVEIAR
jgi:hypothetical protein